VAPVAAAPVDEAPAAAPPAAAKTNGTPRPAGEAVGPEVHAALMQRLLELNLDRQTRWQRIMGTLLGR
jgi:hypothetical protein